MVRKNKRRKEEIAEDWCFGCKDGGLLMVCEYRDCLKAYHPRCVGKDDSFLENETPFTCGLHFCSLCRKPSKFKCFCCPKAVCGKCFCDAEFAIVKGNKGFCIHCTKLALLIEENADVDSDGEKVDFKDRDTYECLFSEYYEIIKKEEGLSSQHAYSAHKFFKKGKNKCDLDPDEIGEGEDDIGDSEDVSNFIVTDCDDLNDTAESKSARKKKGMGKLKSLKGKVKDKKKEFIGWGSRMLIEFLEYIGKDTSKEFSEHDVTSIIIEYCRENNLFDPKKKRKILCDAQLRSLLRRKSVNKNSIQNLLAPHFAEYFEEMDDISSSSEDRGYNEPVNFSRKRKTISCAESHHPNIVSEERQTQSCFAAIVSSNLKLVYLKRSLVDEISKQPETFDGKVLGSYVRVKSDPHDYLQKNSHLLVQVVGINRSLKNGEINKEIMLQLSNVPKDVPICKLSDDDFSEEECQDLYQRMRNGLLKQPTVLELEQKARILHEDIMKHWIPRKLVLLQNRIDQANEKGWRRELSEYMDQKLKLETPLEQSRLLNDIPKVIPEIVGNSLSPEGPPRKDKLELNCLSELSSGKTCNSAGRYSKHSGFAHGLNNRTDVAVQTIAQDVENDKGVPSLDSSQTGGEKPQSNKVQHVYTRRKLQQKKVQRIIPTLEQIDPLISPETVPGPKSPRKENQDGTALHVASVENLFADADSQDKGTSQRNLSQSASKATQDGPQVTLFEELSNPAKQDDPESIVFEESSNPAKYGLCQSRNRESGRVIINGKNLSAIGYTEQTTKEKQSISVVNVDDKQDTGISAGLVEEQKVSGSTTDVIVLSDDDEQEENVLGISVRREAVENPESSNWYCMGPYGEKGGPYSMSVLKRWSESASPSLEFKVWKTGQTETEAIPLAVALNRIFSCM